MPLFGTVIAGFGQYAVQKCVKLYSANVSFVKTDTVRAILYLRTFYMHWPIAVKFGTSDVH